jgi:predicted Zn-dependent protease
MPSIPAKPPAPQPGDYHPRLVEAALALGRNALSTAEPLLKRHLKEDPFDVFAIRMLAELAGRIGRLKDAENLLRRALELAPGFTAARSNLALLLHRTNRPEEALAELDKVRAEEPDDPQHSTLRAAVAGKIGAFDEALALYETILSRAERHAPIWLSYGHTLKTVGRLDDGIAAYRKAIAIRPWFGEAWWSIANLKTAKLGAEDRAAMQAGLEAPEATQDDIMPRPTACGARSCPIKRPKPPARSTGRSPASMRRSSPNGPGRAAPRPIRCSSLACRAPARR